jgi:leucyl aminopeptidase
MTALLEKVDPIPSWPQTATVEVAAADGAIGSGAHEVVAVPVGSSGDLPPAVGVSRPALNAAGFDGTVGKALILPADEGPPVIAYGIGEPGGTDANGLRDAAASFARAASGQTRLAIMVPDGTGVPVEVAAQALVEGTLLARYQYGSLKTDAAAKPVGSLTLLAGPDGQEQAQIGARRGVAYAKAAALARDLANSPPSLLTAARMAACAQAIAGEAGLEVEVFDKDALLAMGCGGLLGVNAGSADPPRMIKLRYRPSAGDAETPSRLTLVGKGIMYDSGGISLKPADAVHATMKNDMSGAGAILAAMAVLKQLDCPTAVTGYLMCTDNMPSGTATKLGDVLSIRGGTTVEVINSDAEGRLVMADALVLATEEPCDAIVDIATLTGACMRALGAQMAGVFGNDQHLVDQVLAAANTVDEPAWQLPLAHRYREELDSGIADIKNMGGPNGAAIHAALFLEEFVAGKPWAHIDIAGPAQTESATGWQTPGCSGFGARLLVELAGTFTRTAR